MGDLPITNIIHISTEVSLNVMRRFQTEFMLLSLFLLTCVCHENNREFPFAKKFKWIELTWMFPYYIFYAVKTKKINFMHAWLYFRVKKLVFFYHMVYFNLHISPPKNGIPSLKGNLSTNMHDNVVFNWLSVIY